MLLKGDLPRLVLDDSGTPFPGPTPPNSATIDPRELVSFPSPTLPAKTSPTSLSPLSLATLLPPPPSPHPWVWRCHYCRVDYRLSCTRRCLECSHEFCTSISGGNRRDWRRRMRSGSSRICSAEFDYAAWAAWGAYRRMTSAGVTTPTVTVDPRSPFLKRVPMADSGSRSGSETDTFAAWQPAEGNTVWERISEREAKAVASRKEALFVEQRHDCWLHCDYPSECRHTTYAACVGGRARAEGKKFRVIPLRQRRGNNF